MTKLQLRDYQKDAVTKLVAQLKYQNEGYKSGNRNNLPELLLQAPTGAGKTVMLAEFLKHIANPDNEFEDFVHVVIAPNSLHTQLYGALKEYGVSSENGLNLIDKDSLTQSEALPAGSVLLLNWASVNTADKVLLRENERETDLGTIFRKTREEGTKISFIVDEAHLHETEKSKVFKEVVEPSFSLNITATPTSTTGGIDSKIVVSHADVVKEGVIVEKTVVNDSSFGVYSEDLAEQVKTKNIPDFLVTENNQLVYAAVRKSLHMDSLYEEEGSDVRTVVGVQLPVQMKHAYDIAAKDLKDSKEEEEELERVLSFLDKVFDYTIDSGEVAVLLANDKRGFEENKETIKNYDSKIKVLIFKYAIAVGYDLPRMKVGALLHNSKTKSFAIQTLGRFIRQPELKHYMNHELNRAYIYTKTALLAHLASDYSNQVAIQPQVVEIKAEHKEFVEKFNEMVSLKNYVYKTNNVGQLFVTNLRPRLEEVISKQLENRTVKSLTQANEGHFSILSKLGFDMGLLTDETVRASTIESVDDGVISENVESSQAKTLADKIERLFWETTLYDIDTDKAIFERNFRLVLNSFLKEFGTDQEGNELVPLNIFARLVLFSDKNKEVYRKIVQEVVKTAKQQNPNQHLPRFEIVEVNKPWTIPLTFEIPQNSEGAASVIPSESFLYDAGVPEKSLDSENERKFLNEEIGKIKRTIENSGNTFVGFIKNGTQNTQYLALTYKDETKEIKQSLFYPDWLFFYKIADNEPAMLIIETKSQKNIKGEIEAKAKGLADYLKSHRNTNPEVKVIGAIVNYQDSDAKVVGGEESALHTWLSENL